MHEKFRRTNSKFLNENYNHIDDPTGFGGEFDYTEYTDQFIFGPNLNPYRLKKILTSKQLQVKRDMRIRRAKQKKADAERRAEALEQSMPSYQKGVEESNARYKESAEKRYQDQLYKDEDEAEEKSDEDEDEDESNEIRPVRKLGGQIRSGHSQSSTLGTDEYRDFNVLHSMEY